MILRFLKTKIGMALIAAVIIIGIATGLKFATTRPAQSELAQKVSVIADTSVKAAIENGQPSNLSDILGTTTPISNTIATLNPETASDTTQTTATDRFAQAFFQQYIDLKQSGATIDQNTGTNLVNSLLSQDYGSSITVKTYTESDIKVISTTLQAAKAYGNNLGAILQAPLPKGYVQELTTITAISTDPNSPETSDDLSKLSINIAHYQGLQSKIAALSVPNALKAYDVALLNSLSDIIAGLQGMMAIQTDPVGATKMISVYQDGIDSLAAPLQAMKAYFNSQSIAFSSSESGYILTQ